MCWNYEVSLGFSVVFLVINSYYVFAKPRYWKEYLMFGMFYFVMEAYQTLQWLYGNVYTESALQGISNCDITNQNFTIFGHVLIWLQPVLFSYIGYRTSTERKFFRYYNYVTIVVLLLSLVSISVGFYKNDYYQINNSIFGLSTCTNKGATGHLVWRFKPASIEYFPNYLTYVIMCVMSFLMYDRSETRIIGAGWLVSLVITKIVLRPTMLEIASSWCLLSVIANVMIFVYLKI
ncbi:hypothetical protein QJ856_gp0265 [Tupanvirus deep ocean]|uniref:Uncharacterized protein n=2 Tax=Tupanvirus TaxID=2094720 RepID=A0AC62A9W3_9VIRU|nr:hypothetical protein QJ856_gp0265 [Tupanvirus deep ocean]QKU34467.1 hypothetical protein [Tupanvirus deep ocean]